MEFLRERLWHTEANEQFLNSMNQSGAFVAPWPSAIATGSTCAVSSYASPEERVSDALARLAVATPEDLIVMKLIANRAKDRADLDGRVRLEGLDWTYVERWAAEWEVLELLRRVRDAARG